MANLLPLAAPLTVVIEAAGQSRFTGLRRDFERSHGAGQLEDVLRKAGFDHGRWALRILNGVRACNETPFIQVRRFTTDGVHLHLKPGGPDTGTKAILLVTKDKGVSPEQVFERLKDAVFKDRGAVGGRGKSVDHVEFRLDDAQTDLVLRAVQWTEFKVGDELAHYLGRLGQRLLDDGIADADENYALEAAEHLVDRGLLADRKTYYALTDAGEERVGMAAAIRNPRPDNGTSPADLLIHNRDRLLQLATAGEELEKLRRQQEDIQKQVAETEALLARLRVNLLDVRQREQDITHGLDVKALQRLLGGGGHE